MRTLWLTITCLAAAGWLGAHAAAQAPAPDPGATFDAVWERIQATHPDTAFFGVDWQAVRAELRPRALAAPDNETLRDVIRDMLRRLGQSHFALIPAAGAGAAASATPRGTTGLDVRLLDGEAVVFSVEEGSAAAAAGVRPGLVLHRIDHTCVADVVSGVHAAPHWLSVEYRARSRILSLLDGAPATEVRLSYRAGGGVREVALLREAVTAPAVRFGQHALRYARLDQRVVTDDRTGAVAGVIRFNLWLPTLLPELHRAVHDMRDAAGIVLDLRGNPGGAGAMVMGAAGLFLEEPLRLGTTYMRHDTLHIRAVPRRVTPDGQPGTPFDGRLAILIDETSASASESFAGGMQAVGRARVFGRRSAGGVLPSHTVELPNGDVLQYAVGEFRTAAGVRLEGRGVQPDSVVLLERAALERGSDPDLDAALHWIHGGAAHDTARSAAHDTLPATAHDTLPAAEALYARHVAATGGREAHERLTGLTLTGRIEIRPLGMHGTLTVHLAAGRSASVSEIEGVGKVRSGYIDGTAWTINPVLGPMLLDGANRENARQQADLQAALHPDQYYAAMRTVERVRFAGRDAYRVRVRSHLDEEFDEFFDVVSGLMVGTERRQDTPAGPVSTTTLYEDYRVVAEVRTPGRIVQRAAGVEQVITFERIDAGIPSAELFELPLEIVSLLRGR